MHLPLVPSRRFVLLLGLGLFPAFLSFLRPAFAWATLATDGLLLVLLVVDRLRAPSPQRLSVRREVDEVLSIGTPAPVRLTFVWRGRRSLGLMLCDTPPEAFEASDELGRLSLPPNSEVTFTYRVQPTRRGRHAFGDLYLRIRGPWGLAWRPHRIALSAPAKVYPDLSVLRGAATELLLSASGRVHRRRRWVSGREFDALREYRPGDDFRQVDWKATARRGHPIVRDYRPDQNQDLYLLLDCGRHMRARVGRYARIDVAVNTALTLAHVALGRGDQVGLVVFSHRVEAYLPPDKGRHQLRRIVDQIYAVEPTLTESDYHAAFDALLRRASRRALVVTFTDVQGEESSEVLLERTLRVRPRHLPVVVTITDEDLVRAAQRLPRRREEAWMRLAAGQLLSERRAVLRRLRAGGASVVDVPADRLAPAALAAYFDLKARGAL